MGLVIQVGVLASSIDRGDRLEVQIFRGDMELINARLSEQGLAVHEEPESLDEVTLRASMTSFPYSWLHYLRRFAAHVMRDPQWVPYPIQPGEDPAKDPVLHQMYRRMDSHLLCHSDREGYYVPVEFDDLILDEDHDIRGGVVGSSHRLREELLTLCSPLEIDVDQQGVLSDEEARKVSVQRPNEVPFARERLVWMALFEAARVSIEKRTAIVFC